ncbi:flagella synthesis protein FlgN [Ferrimonas sediminum]|uniref:Flagella synthesis protein FlgN n=1 Tax=Ferrimonas sediminum TaxID=718193 RepID=A0A1G8ZWS0_9GAMM|nr:flagellar protein FlgN [Ferrimonas sediminum]SDK19582.1 flagella synthesis protein FlgN [Ferrimonas sediminum]
MNKADQVRQLVKGIQLDVKGYQQLKSLLKFQRELMQRRDIDGLEQHNPRQDKLCQSLTANARTRSSILQSLGLPEDDKGMNRLLAAIPGESGKKVSLIWQQLQQLVVHCKAENDANGRLLSGQQRTLNRLVNPDAEAARQNDYGATRP